MNYILTMGEVKTLAGLLGAQSFFETGEQETVLKREDVIQNVFQLHQRGFLSQTDEGFLCEPEIKRLVQGIVEAERVLVLFSPKQGRVCCYISAEHCIALETIAERPMEYKLYAQPLKELYEQFCPIEDVDKAEEYEFDLRQLYFDVLPEENGLYLQAEVYSAREQCQLARAIVSRTRQGMAQAFYANGEMSVAAYRIHELYRLLVEQTGGEEL